MTTMIMPASGTVTGIPGFRCRSGSKNHNGFDVADANGGSILAAADGKVVKVAYQKDGAGHYINLDHGGGWVTKYFHLVKKSPRKEGESVRQGEKIGDMGTSGNSTGVHLHLEILRNDNVINDSRLSKNFPCLTKVARKAKINYSFTGLPDQSGLPDAPKVPYPLQRRGDSGRLVKEIQARLNRYGFAAGAEDGQFGSNTEAAVKKYQQDIGSDVDGVVGPKTWAALLTHEAKGQTLRRGSTGEDVEHLQRGMRATVAYGLSVDGQFGPATEAAVRGYQSARKLGVDGIVGPKTWAALKGGR